MSNVFINQAKIENTFSTFLGTIGVSEKTQVNYISDIRNFFDWMAGFFQVIGTDNDLTLTLTKVTSQTIESYKSSETLNQTPTASVNRRLSSLRAFFKWTQETTLTPTNPMLDVKNIPGLTTELTITPEMILGKFETDLKNEGAADVTVKNYITDVSEFISWMTRNQSG
jgi:site-specific recombinase XerD